MRKLSHGLGRSTRRCGRKWTNACDGNGRLPKRRDLGWGGVTTVAQATGLSRVTIMSGLHELELPVAQREVEAGRVRRAGSGASPVDGK